MEQTPKSVKVKIKCQLKECLRDLKDDSSLTQRDINWGSFLYLHFQKAISNASLPKAWQIRKTETDFHDWITNQSRHSLFFDGAAKSNPENAGARGVILKSDGKKAHSFPWGLSLSSNNQAEALALFQGLELLKALNIKEANVLGNSQIIINVIVSNSPPQDLTLARLITRIKDLGNSFPKVEFLPCVENQ